jgi:hypothetical protein
MYYIISIIRFILYDSNYIDIVKTCIRDTLSEYYSVGNIDDFLHVELLCNDQVFFKILKMKIRSVSITYSIRKSRDEKEKTLKLENDIQILENQMNLNPTEFIQASLNQKKGELENRRQDIVEGLLLRSRANWHENGERCSEYFCKLEKKSSINKTISEKPSDPGLLPFFINLRDSPHSLNDKFLSKEFFCSSLNLTI